MKNFPRTIKEFAKHYGYKLDYSRDGCDLKKGGKCYLAKLYNNRTIFVTTQQYLGAWRLRARLLVIRPLGLFSWEWESYDWDDWFKVVEELNDYLVFKGEKIKVRLVKGSYYKAILIPVDRVTWEKWKDNIMREKMPRTMILKKLLHLL